MPHQDGCQFTVGHCTCGKWRRDLDRADDENRRLRMMLEGAARGIPHVMDQIRREFGPQSPAD